MHPRGRVAVAMMLAALATACAGDDDDAASVVDETVVTTTPTTSPPKTAPPTTPSTSPPTTDAPPKTTRPPSPPTQPPTTEPAAPTTEPSETVASGGIGGPGAGEDELYPELGNAAIDVQHYDVRLAYDPAAETIDGHVTIDALLTETVDEIALDADDIAVARVQVDGDEVPFELTGRDLVISLPEPRGPLGRRPSITIDVGYQDTAAVIQSAMGLPVGWFATDGGSYVLHEPEGASTWLPSNDHPADKATWRFELTVPAGTTAVANGELVGTTEQDGATTWVWDQRDPMSTYLILVLTGDYRILDGGTYDGMAGPVPLVNVALASDVDRMAPYFALTAAQLAFFEPLFGPYPLDRYGLAFSDSFGGLAMETQGRSLFSREDFPGGEPDVVAHLFTAHELAHQWFGDAVSPADWSDLWLNEAFATYGEWLWLDHAGFTTLEELADGALEQRQFPTEPTGTPSVENLFGFERYDGGAVVVHALRQQLGDTTFFDLLTRWVAANDGASRTTDDFIGFAEQVSGVDLDAFFDEWLFAAAVPTGYPT